MSLVLYFSIGLLLWIWILYPTILLFIHRFIPETPKQVDFSHSPTLSVIIAAHNEADVIGARISNILQSDFPQDKLSVVIVSDGSSDDTVGIAERTLANSGLKFWNVIRIDVPSGRAHAHNVAVALDTAEIVCFTDAETTFDRQFLRCISAVFSDAKIGFVSGTLHYQNQSQHVVAESVGRYWQLELKMRNAESAHGLLAVGTGACCAVRRKLYKPIPPTGDVDFTTPLDVVLQGYRCVQTTDALAWDFLPPSPHREFKARVRMTAKNLHGTVARWGLAGVLRHPLVTTALFSHKIGRWVTPIFGLIAVMSSVYLATQNNVIAWIILICATVFACLAGFGFFKFSFPGAGAAYGFALANVSFLCGTVKAIAGKVPGRYTPVRSQFRQ